LPSGNGIDTILIVAGRSPGQPLPGAKGWWRDQSGCFVMAVPNRFSWSVPLAKWRQLDLRVHISLVLLGVVAVAASLETATSFGLLLLGGLLLSVAAHELSHALVAVRLGGEVRRVVLGPHGGLESPHVPDEPEPQICTAMAGPVAHLVLTVVGTAWLAALGDRGELIKLFNPANLMAAISTDAGITFLRSLVWLNWLLFLLNWIPAYPFDGAPTLRAMLWPVVGRRSAVVITSRVALVVAIALVVAGVGTFLLVPVAPAATWVSMSMLGLFVAVSSQRDLLLSRWLAYEHDDYVDAALAGESTIDEAWLSGDSDSMVLVEQHHDQIVERHERQRKAQEAYEDARVDDILARMHDAGFDRLSPEDQAFLKRASERYRSKRGSSVDHRE
jgi:Zn-dependent protease